MSIMNFDALGDLDFPLLQHTTDKCNVADGPFAIDHSGAKSLGGFMHVEDGVLHFLEGGTLRSLSSDYQVSVDAKSQTITIQRPGVESVYTIRPLVDRDMAERFPQLEFSDLDEFKDFLQRLGANGLFQSHRDLSDYAVTADDKDNVLGLFERVKGQMSRRENGNWVPVKPEDSDWAEIDTLRWIPVLFGAVDLFDSHEDKASSALENYSHYIVG